MQQLGIVSGGEPGDLVREGQNLFRSLSQVTPVPPEQRQVRSKYVEQSAVQPTSELLEMIRAQRTYEANVKMIQNFDHIDGQLVNRVLQQ